MEPTEKKSPAPGNVFYIGLLSFFGGVSQDVFLPILPLYLSNVLGFDKASIGLAEGLVASGAGMMKLVSGYLVDRFGRRKRLIFLGYFLSMISRPLLALTGWGGAILGLRLLDGLGKGMKDSPKDALIAESTAVSNRGRGFGVARMLDASGSVAGPLVLFGLLRLLRDHRAKYHIILLFSALPLVVALAVLQRKVKEGPPRAAGAKAAPSEPLPRRYWAFLGIMVLFSLGNSSDAFLVLRAQDAGVTLLAIPLVLALFNFVYAAAAIPLGGLSDRIGREKVIMLGWLAYALAYAGFAFARSPWQIWLLFGFYGLYYATTEGVAKALIADTAAAGQRGRAFGIYNTAIGLVALPASVIAGALWDRRGPAAPFIFGASLSFVALVCLVVFRYVEHRGETEPV